MTSFLLTLSLACPATLVVNNTHQPWTKFDQTTMINSHNRCAAKYENSPCLRKFSKQETRAHRAVCGGTLQSSLTGSLEKHRRR